MGNLLFDRNRFINGEIFKDKYSFPLWSITVSNIVKRIFNKKNQ